MSEPPDSSSKKRRPVTGRCAGGPDGRPCRAFPLSGGTKCFFHEPSTAEKRRTAQRKGGRVTHLIKTVGASPPPDSFRTVGDLVTLVEHVLRGTLTDSFDAKTANALASLIKVQAGLLVDHELETRVAALERRQGQPS